ncbi:MAG: trypsin-like peptidase domain-containing protein [Bacteroides sp.]|jgi:Do/DeqQ family serine protease|nr:trypsin-like peptidase domain-containing protein [Bacteroides sp.]MCI1683223.1 trypsin-like peptidase domain-containing protein [Bacteroides sp.]
MKQRTKNILGVVFIVLLSSGVAGFTTYKVLQKERPAAFSELFEQNPDSNARLASYNGITAQPVDLTPAAKSSVEAVVHIKSTQASKVREVEVQDPFSDFFGQIFGQRGGAQRRQVQTPERVGFGSGVIISKDGYIVTNNHVIDGADEITVKLNDNREFKGRVIGADASSDLALVKIEGDDFPTIPFGDSDAMKVGEWVLAVGNPFNLTSTVTAGIVSAKARSLGIYGDGGIESFIQTDAAINAGNSGGALVNTRGELIGINAVLSSPTGAYAGYGFAIPSNEVKKVISDLRQYGTVQRAMLGIQGMSLGERMIDDQMDEKGTTLKDMLDKLGIKSADGVLVSKIIDGGSAASADIKENDVIIGIDDIPVHKMADLQGVLAKKRPGDKVKIKLIRDKKDKTVEVVLKNAQGTTKVVKNAGMDILGAAFRPVPNELKKQLNLGYGLEVTGVSDGKMKDAGIRKGFIILKANGIHVNTADELRTIMRKAVNTPEQVLFITGIYPSGKRANYAVDLSEN